MKYWVGRDIPGNDLTSKLNVATVDECADHCLANKDCMVFTYALQQLNGVAPKATCWLKRAATYTIVKLDNRLTSGYRCTYEFTPAVAPKTEDISGYSPKFCDKCRVF